MSERTRQTHMHFVRGLAAQFILPFFLLLLPVLFQIMCYIFKADLQCGKFTWEYGSDWCHVGMAVYSLHAPLMSIGIVILTRPYRVALARWWQAVKKLSLKASMSVAVMDRLVSSNIQGTSVSMAWRSR